MILVRGLVRERSGVALPTGVVAASVVLSSTCSVVALGTSTSEVVPRLVISGLLFGFAESAYRDKVHLLHLVLRRLIVGHARFSRELLKICTTDLRDQLLFGSSPKLLLQMADLGLHAAVSFSQVLDVSVLGPHGVCLELQSSRVLNLISSRLLCLLYCE